MRKPKERGVLPLTLFIFKRPEIGVSFGGNELLKFEDETVAEIMGEVRLEEVNKLQQLGNRFRQTEIQRFYEFRYFNCILRLEDNAFEGCRELEEIALPEFLYTIGHHSFSHCESLKRLTLPDSIEIIGDSAFSGCSSLSTITLPWNVKAIGSYVFSKYGT